VITGSVVRYRALGWSCLSAQVSVGRRCMSSPTAIDYPAGRPSLVNKHQRRPEGPHLQVKSSHLASCPWHTTPTRAETRNRPLDSTPYSSRLPAILRLTPPLSKQCQCSHTFGRLLTASVSHGCTGSRHRSIACGTLQFISQHARLKRCY
jgi:hypothetical protein